MKPYYETERRLNMKRTIMIIAAITTIIMTISCAGWKVNGVDLHKIGRDMKTADAEDMAIFVSGALSSAAIHTLGHIAYVESRSKDWHMTGLSETLDEPMGDRETRWFARIGFITQLSAGMIFNRYMDPNNTWLRGYNFGTLLEITSYPIRNQSNGDLATLEDAGGNAYAEWVGYSMLATWPYWEIER